ncbi:MAG: MarR family winged helix-turn-helix transcriptional regulator [Steroidobacterales bacterium]
MVAEQIKSMEANLARLSRLMPKLPKNELLIVRLVSFLAHDVGLMLEQLIRPFGLSEGEFRVLAALYSQPHSTAHPGDLCARVRQSPANMSRITDALVERHLITRVPCAQDRRRLVLRITEKGAALVHRVLPAIFEPLRELFADHSAKDQERLITLLRELVIRLNAVTGSNGAESAP